MNQVVIRDTDEEVVASSSRSSTAIASRSNTAIAVEIEISAVLGCFAAQIGITDVSGHSIGPILKCQAVCYINPSVWGHLIPSSYCDVGRFFYRVFKF